VNNVSFLKSIAEMSKNGLGAPILVILMMSMMVVPLAAFMLDVFFTFNIALSLIILLVVIYLEKPLDFATFPTIILVATLLRLALNVASTRVVLLEGHSGGAAAGKVIEAFGAFVIGGNYAVGFIVFAILVIINFIVVTKGAGRISEVTARFTLDAMPGKQMAIDADMNAGVIGQEEARVRREEVTREAGFYGAMDGASKFVRGDAIAGIIILVINIIGGLAIGMAQHGLDFSTAAHHYSLLTIGDGLVAQIPSLLLSTASAVIITRVSATENMSAQVSHQLFGDVRPLVMTAGILGILGMIPGMPNTVFLLMAGAFGFAGYMVHKKNQVVEEDVPEEVEDNVPQEAKDLSWDDVPAVDIIGLEVGYGLIPLVDKEQGGQLMSRIKGIRKKMSQELGFLVQPVHIRDNLQLAPNSYRIILSGVPMGEAELQTKMVMAINPGTVYGTIQGLQTKDPAFGLEAWWIEPGQKDHAQTMGYTVVDSSTVCATHLSHILENNSHLLLGHEEVQQLLDSLAKSSPKLVENLVPDVLPLSIVVKVLQNLLSEGVPLRDMRTIVEVMAEVAPKTQETKLLTMHIRESLSRMIVQKINGMALELPVMTFDPMLEQILQQSSQASDNAIGMEPGLAEKIHSSLMEVCKQQEMKQEPCVLLLSPEIRSGVAKWLKHSLPSLHVLSYNEVPEDKQIRIIATVGNEAIQIAKQ